MMISPCLVVGLLFLLFGAHTSFARRFNCDIGSLDVGVVFTPADPTTYDQARAQFASNAGSAEFSDTLLAPDAIVFGRDESDVLEVIRFASLCNYKLSIRSGGHNYAGYSSCKYGTRCIQLDVSQLDTFSHQAGTNVVTLGVGLTLEKVSEMLVPLGLVIPMGLCNFIRIGGHFQSSSVGLFTRSLGLGMDHVTSFRIATADGSIKTVSPDSYPDLYRAVLGGSPGSWGVVLDYTFEATSAAEYPNSAITAFMWPWDRNLYSIIANVYLNNIALPEGARDFSAALLVASLRSLREVGDYTNFIQVFIAWTGGDNGSLYDSGDNYAKFIQPFKDAAGIAPQVLLDTPAPINGMMDALLFDFNFSEFRYHVDGTISDDYFSTAFMEEAGDEIEAYLNMTGVLVSFQFLTVGATGSGSQFNRNVGLNSFPYRELVMVLDKWVFFEDGDQSGVIVDRMDEFHNRTKNLVSNNGVEKLWLTTETPKALEADLKKDWKSYYPSRPFYRALQDVKWKYDPCDLFSTDMTVPLPKNPRTRRSCRRSRRRSRRRSPSLGN